MRYFSTGFRAFLERSGPIILVALMVRLAVAVMMPLPEDFAALTDSGLTALNLATGHGYTHDFYGRRPDVPLQAYMPPLHVAYVYVSLLSPNPRLAHSLQQVLAGVLAVWCVHRLARAIGGRFLGGVAGWAMALYPTYVLMTSIPESVVLFVACMAALLLLAWRMRQEPTPGRAVLTGLALGLMTLGRPQALLLLPVLVLWLTMGRFRWPALWRNAGLLCLAAGLVVVPWVVRNWLVLQTPVLVSTNGGRTIWLGNNPFTTGSGGAVYADLLADYQGTERDPNGPRIIEFPGPYPLPHELDGRVESLSETELDRSMYRAAWDYVRRHPGEWLKLEARKIVSFWWFRPNVGSNPNYASQWKAVYRFVYAGVLILALLGLLVSRRRWRRYLMLYSVLIVYGGVCLVFHVLTRFRWEVEFILLIFMALAVTSLWTRRPGGKVGR